MDRQGSEIKRCPAVVPSSAGRDPGARSAGGCSAGRIAARRLFQLSLSAPRWAEEAERLPLLRKHPIWGFRWDRKRRPLVAVETSAWDSGQQLSSVPERNPNHRRKKALKCRYNLLYYVFLQHRSYRKRGEGRQRVSEVGDSSSSGEAGAEFPPWGWGREGLLSGPPVSLSCPPQGAAATPTAPSPPSGLSCSFLPRAAATSSFTKG